MRRFRIVAFAVTLLLLSSVAISKASLSKLLVSGGKLSRPVELTASGVLRASNPWFGTFIPQWNKATDDFTPGPPEDSKRYELSFYAAFSDSAPPHIIYTAYYANDPGMHRCFVYLPGEHEQWYSTNASSILRPKQDGRWNLADLEWCEQLNAAIGRAENP